MKPLLIFINGWGFNKGIFDPLLLMIDFDHDIHFIDPTNELDVISKSKILLTSKPKIIITWSLGLAYYLDKSYTANNVIGLVSISGSPCFIKCDNYTLGWDLKIVNRMIKKLLVSPSDVMSDFINKSVYHRDSKLSSNIILESYCFDRSNGIALSYSLDKLTSIDTSAKIKTVNCDILIIQGKEDCIVSYRNSIWLNENMKNSELKLIDGCGHIPHIEATKETATYINNFYLNLRSQI